MALYESKSALHLQQLVDGKFRYNDHNLTPLFTLSEGQKVEFWPLIINPLFEKLERWNTFYVWNAGIDQGNRYFSVDFASTVIFSAHKFSFGIASTPKNARRLRQCEIVE